VSASEERIRRALEAERLEDLEATLGTALPEDVLDRLVHLDVEPQALIEALDLGRELLLAHRADEPVRRRDHAAEMALRRRGDWPGLCPVPGRPGLWIARDGSSSWRRAPRPVGRGNPEHRIRALIRGRLVALGVRARDLRERLLATLSLAVLFTRHRS
jgi:hypothetical protein